MASSFNFNVVVLKRHRAEEIDRKRDTTKKCKRFSSNTPTKDLDSFVEDEPGAVVYRESTRYDDLLASLGSSNKVVADINRRRQIEEEGRSDTEGDDDDEDEENIGSEDQSSTYGEEDDEIQGVDKESLGVLSKNTKQEKNDDNHSEQDYSDYSETDEENEMSTSGQSSLVASSSTSAFSEHLSHKLSSEEVET